MISGLPEEPAMIRDTHAQDRPLDRAPGLRRHGKLMAAILGGALTLGLLLTLLLRFSDARNAVDRARLSIATVERGSFVRDVAADGQVVAAVSPTLYSSAAGTVNLKVHAGDTVSKDQLLAIIESPDLTAKFAQEDATLQGLRIDWQRAQLDAEHKLRQLQDAYQQAQVDQKTAQRESDRARKAYELGSYPELQALKAQDALEKAQFTLEQARINYESQPRQNRFDIDSKRSLYDRQQYLVTDLQGQLDRLNVRSPIDGQIGQVQIADRANVARDAPLLTVVDLSALEVDIKVAESLARDLRPGMVAELQGGGRRWTGSVSGVSPQVVNGQVITRVRFGAEQPDGLRQSQRLAVRILIERREQVLMVDRGASLDQDGAGFGYVVHGDVADRQPIRLGATSVGKVEILSGLTVGDQVVISGTDAFNAAQHVNLSH
jgi:HlyD family secretion protein